jgi:gluconate 5-dehydrogenase
MSLNYFKQTYGLKDQVALVTGAATGLGFAIARHLGLDGARLIINDLDETRCEQAAKDLGEPGVVVRVAVFDVSDAGEVEAAVRGLDPDWAPDILVSNAGNQNRQPVVKMAPAQWQSLFNVHVNGAFNCALAVLPSMVAKNKGSIILMSSVAGQACMSGIAGVCVGKGRHRRVCARSGCGVWRQGRSLQCAGARLCAHELYSRLARARRFLGLFAKCGAFRALGRS